MIRKGKASKPTEFGKLVKLQEAENQIIVDYEVFARRPSDMDLLIPAIDVHQAKLGRMPRSPPMPASTPPGTKPQQKPSPGLTVFSRILFYVSVFWTCGEVLALQCRRDSGMIRR